MSDTLKLYNYSFLELSQRQHNCRLECDLQLLFNIIKMFNKVYLQLLIHIIFY